MRNCFVKIIAVMMFLVMGASVIGCEKASEEMPNGTQTPESTQMPGADPESTATALPGNTAERENCLAPSGSAQEWINIYNEKNGNDAAEKVILDIAGIEKINAEMDDAADFLVDIKDFDKSKEIVTAGNLRKWISASISYNPAYKEDGTVFSGDELRAIYDNRNIDAAGSFEIAKGVIVSRANIRTVPYSGYVLKAADNMPYDRIQESEIAVGMPVWVLHESADAKYYYIQTYYYRGWVLKETVAVAENDEDWELFASPEEFVVVTDKLLDVDGRKVDMGVALPLERVTESGFMITMPASDESGRLVKRSVEISAGVAHEGYVPYTMANFYTQAFKYIGTIYGWGGMDNGVDCSSFVCSVMRSFGFKMPRNTSQQSKIMCDPIDLKSLGSSDKTELFGTLTAPAALFSTGHVTLVLGEKDGKYYIIHAPSAGKPVCVAEISIMNESYTYLSVMKEND